MKQDDKDRLLSALATAASSVRIDCWWDALAWIVLALDMVRRELDPDEKQVTHD